MKPENLVRAHLSHSEILHSGFVHGFFVICKKTEYHAIESYIRRNRGHCRGWLGVLRRRRYDGRFAVVGFIALAEDACPGLGGLEYLILVPP